MTGATDALHGIFEDVARKTSGNKFVQVQNRSSLPIKAYSMQLHNVFIGGHGRARE